MEADLYGCCYSPRRHRAIRGLIKDASICDPLLPGNRLNAATAAATSAVVDTSFQEGARVG